MRAKLTTRNRVTLPKQAVDRVPAEVYRVQTDGHSIILTPAGADPLQTVQEKLAALGIVQRDIEAAVRWAREK